MGIIRFPFRLIGLALLALATVLLVDDLVHVDWATVSGFAPDALGNLIYQAAPDALNGTQAFIQRYVWPYLWDPIIQSVLRVWDWAILGGLGAFLAILARRPKVRIDAAALETAG